MGQQKEMAYKKLSPAYESSMLNPCRAEEKYPGLGAWYAAFQAEIAGRYEEACLHREELLAEKEKLASEAEALFGEAKEGERVFLKERLAQLWKRYLIRTADIRALDFVEGMVRIGTGNPYEAILQKANGQ